jgi:simple sugar transport system ATP-binding protein/ribose transport system ATP-binding protein
LASSAGFEVPADRPVGSLSIAQQQEVEILRALARDARLIVMDEPTARLSMAETEKLHEVIRKLAADGRSVLLISHFLDEVLSVADEMTILRDGRVVRHGPTSAETRGTCIEAMLGRKLGAQFPDQQLPPAEAPVVLQAVGLSGPGFSDVSLTLRAGEIVGLAGLVGAGRSEFARAVIGAAPTTAGRIEIGGSVARFRTPRQGLSEGLVMIPESRRDQGLFYLRPTRENVSVSSLGQFTRLGIVQMGRERRATGEMLGRVSVNASAETPLTTLSGGNQQKVLFARAMLTRPAALLADEPTRGVDIGAKRAIYDILVGLAAEGLAILLISSEMEEIIGLAHRVVVMRGGRVTAELAGDQISQQRILHAAFEAQLDEPMALPA